jgi:alpha-D-xyloside xylohydrolase
MIADLKRDGFHISLWQLPYFVPKNSLFPEILAKGLAVKDGKGNLPYEDAVLDFTNPATVAVVPGEDRRSAQDGRRAPSRSISAKPRRSPASTPTAAADSTNTISIRCATTRPWPISPARSPAKTSSGRAARGPAASAIRCTGAAIPATRIASMAATLRGGLSFGLSGFTFWSHDIGGFTAKTPEELYSRWLPFGMLTSHSRCHGAPPKEPWEYSAAFLDLFRRTDEMKYRLMPYIYAQAKQATVHGLPMVRALFVEYPNDPGAWQVDNEYLFGSDILVAPLLEANTTGRDVYLPAGDWIDYQTGKLYSGGWHKIEAGAIPVVMLVRDGAVIPQMEPAQSTAALDWSKLELVVYASHAPAARGLVCLPSDNVLHEVEAAICPTCGTFALAANPLKGKAALTVRMYSAAR